MDSEKWKKAKEVLGEVLELEPGQREGFLSGLDDEIRQEVESLLAFEEESESSLLLSAADFSRDFFDTDGNPLIGQRIGSYRIVRELGHGGMGAVYLAERDDGKFDQTVALKLLKREMNTAALRRRFQLERDILASLEHPSIARLLDAGTTDDGIPFLAMEYVEGLSLDEYCNQHSLDLAARLDIFRSVCSAVSFAHRNLIVHRDLKPSNIIIDDEGAPKLLDFGISKILSSELDQQNSATVTKLGVMTPGYASPEQLQGQSVTTATDIYSLGVILYELLTGHRPFEAKEGDMKEIFRAVIETEPVAPSVISATGSKDYPVPTLDDAPTLSFGSPTAPNSFRRTLTPKIGVSAQALRGDLDNIVLKALRKEPSRRYTSVETLADDIQRHQRGLPVTARPNTFRYRAGKFVTRNRGMVVAGALLVIVVIAGIIATLWQARAAQIERAKAEKRFNDVRSLANSYLFEVYPEIENLEGSLKAREKILTSALQYLDSLSTEATGDLELQSELATAYEKIGDVQGALTNSSLGNIQAGLDSYRKAARLREAVYQANPTNIEAKEKLANNYYVTARTLWNNSETAEAEKEFENALKLRRELVTANPGSVEYQNRLAVLLIDYGAIPVFNSQTEKALVLFNEALAIVEKLRNDQPDNADFKKTLTRLLRIMSKAKGSIGDYEGGIRGLTLAADVSRELAAQFPKDFRVQRSVWLTNSITCELYIDKADGAKAVETCLPTIEFPKTALANEPENGVVAFDLAISHFNTSRAYRLSENYPDTIAQAEKAIAVMSQLSTKTPDNLEYKRNLAIYQTEIARAQLKLGRYDAAIADLEKIVGILVPISEADEATTTTRQDIAIAYRLMAQAFYRKGDRSKAIECIDKSIVLVTELRNMNALRDVDKDLVAELESEKAEYAK
ncbi:MAG TPA: protein kinase [Pyrinomonadaceae bacterium]|nr:protein kinase [Pyrinomonadaceae bacterium]